MANILLCGNDKDIINDFFCSEENDSSFKFISTTENPEDIRRHIKAFNPVCFVFCVDNQMEDSLIKLDSVYDELASVGIKFVIVGSDDELNYLYSRFGANKINDTLCKDLSFPVILERISSLVGNASESDDSSMVDIDVQSFTESHESNNEIYVPAEKKKILIIDDDATILRTIKLYLQDDYSVAVATSGHVGLKYLEENKVDLVLLDYKMPMMDGPLVLTRIRNTYDLHDLPVIFLSGVSDREKIREILSYHVQGYLLKPVNKEKLQKAIEKALGEEM